MKKKLRRAIKFIYKNFDRDEFTYYNDKIKDVLLDDINLDQFKTNATCEYWTSQTMDSIFRERFPDKKIIRTEFPEQRFAAQSSEYYIIETETKKYFFKVCKLEEFYGYVFINNVLKYLNLPLQPKLMIPKQFFVCEGHIEHISRFFKDRYKNKKHIIMTEVARGEPLAQYFIDFVDRKISKDDMIKLLLDVNRANAKFHKFFLRKNKDGRLISIYHDDPNSGNIFYDKDKRKVSWIDFSGISDFLVSYYVDLFNLKGEVKYNNDPRRRVLINFFPSITVGGNIPIKGLSDDPNVYKICVKAYLDVFKDHPLYYDVIESLKPEMKEVYLSA